MTTILKVYKIVLVALFLSALPVAAKAATLYFSPASGSYAVGKTIAATIYVSSADQAANAASGTVAFPADKLEVTSLSKTGSILSLWVQEPVFSNSAGTIDFEGIAFNPGFTGTGGKLITVNFRVKAAGTAALNFSSGSVLANDGQGTNILTGLGKAQFNLGEEVVPEVPIVPVAPTVTSSSGPVSIPAAPQISSSTHPDPNKWYAVKTAEFAWRLSADTTGARLLVGKIAEAVPTVNYIPAISAKKISDLEDGVWYFSVRLRNGAGWGSIAHFRFQIDTAPPTAFTVTELVDADNAEPTAKFVLSASDATSGISHYEVQIDGEAPQTWQDDGTKTYVTSPLAPGKHILIAKAIDKAGNSADSSLEFTIDQSELLASSESLELLEPPVIAEYPKKITSGEALIIRGTTKYPNAQTVVQFVGEGNEARNQVVENDANGNFTFVTEEKFKDGVYKVQAEVVDEQGIRSAPSEKIIIYIGQPAFLKIGSWLINVLAVLIPFVALLLILMFMVWYGWHKFSLFRKKLKKEVSEAEAATHQAFDQLTESVRRHVKMLEKTGRKRALTKEEEKIVKYCKKNLAGTEKCVVQEIKGINKAMK
jgi:hypothetical protein